MTPHFSDEEVTCKCGCGMLPKQDFMDRVEELRVKVDAPMAVSSGARCAAHNQAVSRTGTTGPHTTGRAIDLKVSGHTAYKVVMWAGRLGFTGIGISQKGSQGSRFVHLDDLHNRIGQPRPWIWSY